MAKQALKELVQEAIDALQDDVLSTLVVTKVDGAKNKSDAKVYILKEDFDAPIVLKRLSKASKTLRHFALMSSGWATFPKMTFCIDENFEKEQRLEALFEQIKNTKVDDE